MAEFFEELITSANPPTYKYYDGSAWNEGKNHAYVDVISPVDGKTFGRVPAVSHEEIDAIISRAREAQKEWVMMPLNKRATILHLAADWIREHEEYFVNLLVMEIGKTTDEAKGEIKRTADLIDYYTDEAGSIRGEEIESDSFPGFEKGKIAMVDRDPWGVVLAIAPFNYPVNLAASKIAPALLMGNACILKPPTNGSIVGLHLVQAFVKAGVPNGILSCITGGGKEVGEYAAVHSGTDMIALTGSTETGSRLAAVSGMKPLLFELGGNNPIVVMDDADFMFTASEIVKGSFSYAGQRCTGIKYILCQDHIKEKLLPILLEMVKEKTKVGDPRNHETKLVGPVISSKSAMDIEKRIRDAIDVGATVVCGGVRKGTYVEPTILTNVTPDMNVIKTETFGPVVSFVCIKTTDEAVDIINASQYGLQASIFTKNEGTGIRLGKRLNVGTVQINSSPQRGPDHFPFLGIKKSGLGVQGVRYSLEAMSRVKSIVLNKL